MEPVYNILKKAGSSLGYQHTAESLTKVRENLAVLNKAKGFQVEIVDTNTNITTKYDSIRSAASAIGCAHKSLIDLNNKNIKTGAVNLFKGRYQVKITRNSD
jgi:hypothetical protein